MWKNIRQNPHLWQESDFFDADARFSTIQSDESGDPTSLIWLVSVCFVWAKFGQFVICLASGSQGAQFDISGNFLRGQFFFQSASPSSCLVGPSTSSEELFCLFNPTQMILCFIINPSLGWKCTFVLWLKLINVFWVSWLLCGQGPAPETSCLRSG